MLAVLEDLRGELGYTMEVRDVDENPEWRERYGPRIPVLTAADEEICHFFLDLPRLRAWLSR
jgi:hypothetical protein